MNLVPLFAAFWLLVLPGMIRRWLYNLHPGESAKITLASLFGGLLSLMAALALCTAPLIVQMTELQPGAVIGKEHLLPGGPGAGWFNLTVLTLIAIAITSTVAVHFVGHKRLRADAVWGRIDADVNVLPITTPLAFALPGKRPWVFISQGLYRMSGSRPAGRGNAP